MATYKDVLMLVDKVSEPLRKIQSATEKTNKSFKDLGEKLTKVGKNMKTVGGKITSTVTKITATVTAFAAGTVYAMKKAAEYGDRIDKMSQKIGMSRESFQEWDYILSQNGGNIDSLQMGFKTLTTQIGMAGKGSKESVAMFKRLGVSIKDNNGNLRKQDDVFNDTITALQKMGETTERDVIAQKLFGRSFIEVKPLLNQSAEAIDKLRKKANDMGLILSKEDVDNARDFKDTMDTFTRFFQAKFATIAMKLMPKFIEILEKILSKTDTIEKIMGYLFKLIEVFVNLVDWFTKLDTKWQIVIASAVAFLGVLGPLITSIGSIISLLGSVATALGTTTGAVAAATSTFLGWVAVFAGIAAGIWAVIKAIQVLIGWIQHLNKMKINNLDTGNLSGEALDKLRAKRQQMGAKKFDAAYPELARQIKQADKINNNSVRQVQNNNTYSNTSNVQNFYGNNGRKQAISTVLNPNYIAPAFP